MFIKVDLCFNRKNFAFLLFCDIIIVRKVKQSFSLKEFLKYVKENKMQNIHDLSFEEMQNLMSEYNQPKFRAQQLFENVYMCKKFVDISNLPKEIKQKLSENFCDQPLQIHTTQKDVDGTEKFAFLLQDGNIIEGVLMRYKYGNTLCLSTQVGCRMGCKFCASTLNGLARNLTAGEMLYQVLLVNTLLGGTLKKRAITNLVLMGSGEPLDNFENVTKFLSLVCDERGVNFSPRNISISTCGIVPKIKELADKKIPYILTISLHAPNYSIRQKIMPISKAYKIEDVISAAKYYFEKTGRRVIFEYALIDKLNNSFECAKHLHEITKGFPSHINVIPLNAVKERTLLPVSRKQAYQFVSWLQDMGSSATVRRTIGENIDGACGQLRNKILNNKSM